MESQITLPDSVTWASLTEVQPEVAKTPIERANPEHLPEAHQHWLEHGYVVLPNFMPDDLINRYVEARGKLTKDRSAKDNYYGGWHYPTPYMDCEELRDIALDQHLMYQLWSLIGDPMALHLCLTGWVSTERNWHQDTYLNPDYLWSYYAAAWIALDDITEDSGPFEMVPGSHKWDVLRRTKLFEHLNPAQRQSPNWPTFTQDAVSMICKEEIAAKAAETIKFVPKRGDVLIWHSNLVHRGTQPTNQFALRKSLICHYSSIARRLDMDKIRRHTNGMLYFDLPSTGSVRPIQGE